MQNDFPELKEYVNNSEVRIINDYITLKLSKELAPSYDEGKYIEYLNIVKRCFKEVKSLGIKLPNDVNPKLYIYIVPYEISDILLKTPKAFHGGKGGGRPVTCFEEDGYVSAYGVADDLASRKYGIVTQATLANTVHEMAHIIQSMYFRGNPLGEGFAEMVTYYGLDYENKYEDHKNFIKDLKDEDILSLQELLNEKDKGIFGVKELIPNSICSFRQSYVSSYLLVKGMVERFEENKGISKVEAIDEFLNVFRKSHARNWQEVFVAFANELDMDINELMNSKNLQLNARDNIIKEQKKSL
jgi:hypothetical protein